MRSSSLLNRVLSPLRIVTILSMLLALLSPFTQLDTTQAAGTFNANPSSLSFGNVALGVISTVQTITVTNTGTGNFTISNVSNNSGNTADFLIGTDTCTGKIIGTGAGTVSSCTVNVTFKPTALGNRSTNLRFNTDTASGSNGNHDVPLSGTGVKRATTTGVTCTPTSVSVNNPVSCTVTVTDSQGSGTTSSPGTGGSVTMSSSGTGNFGTCTLSTGNPSATCTVSYTPTAAGSHTITATYNGGTNHAGSSGSFATPITVTTVFHSTTTSVSCSPNPAFTRVATSCTATVTDTNASPITPTGSVSFSNGNNLGSCTLSSGACSISYTPNADGSQTITATYGGDSGHTGSNNTTTLVVKVSNTTEVSCNPNPDNVGGPTVCTVTVTVDNSQPQPNGTVSFSSTGSGSFGTGGTCSLFNGGNGHSNSCVITYTPGVAGSVSITANYDGGTRWQATSGSTTLGVQANPRTTSTSVTCTPASILVNGAITCTATVLDIDTGSGSNPAGIVRFTSSGSGTFSAAGGSTFNPGTPPSCNLNDAGANSNKATCSVTYTPSASGSQTITGSYAGDNNHAVSSGTFGATVTARTTSTAVVCTPSALNVGNSANCVITITDNQAGGTPSAPLGTVALSVSPSTDGSFSASTCTLSAGTGSASTCSVTYTPSASGTQTITASYTSTDSIHGTSSSTATLTVSKNTTSLAVSAASGTYGGTVNLSATLSSGSNGVGGKTITFTLNGANAGTATTDGSGVASLTNVSLSGINAGTYSTGVGASFAGDATYASTTGSAALTVDKATATMTLDNASLSQVYNGSPRVVTVTTTPAGLSGVSITYAGSGTAPTNAGSYAIVASLTNSNYTASNATGTLQITQATATLSLSNLNQIYDGTPRPVTVTTNPAGLSGVTVTYDAGSTVPTNAGSYAVVATLSDPNYLPASANGTLVISPASATITLSGLNQTYDGTPKAVTATTSPAGLNVVSITYDGSSTVPTNAGSYAIVASLSNPNYTAPNATGTLVISKASATVTLSGLSQTYDGTARVVTATTNPAGLTVNITYAGSSTAPTNAGSYAIVATISDSNYQGSVTDTLVVAKAVATVTLSNLSYNYDGTSKSATVTTSPAGLTVNVTYNGSAALPKNAGSYTVAATINETNYQGSATDTLVIAKIALVGTAQDKTKIYGADLPVLTVSYSGFVNGEGVEVLSGALSCSTSATAASPVGSYSIDCSGQTGSNYNVRYVAGTLIITPATLTATVDNKTRIFGEANPTFTVTYTGFVNGDTLSVVTGTLDCSTTATTSSPIGDYPITCSGQTAPNYTVVYVAGTLTITRAPTTLVVSAVTGTYGGTVSLTATLTSGGNGVSGKTITFTLNGGAAGTATTDSTGVATVSSASLSGINAGTYPSGVGASFAADTGYAAASTSASLTVNKASASVLLSNLNQTYDGTAKTASVATVPSGLTVVVVYSQNSNPVANPTNAGSYDVSATINETNYEGSATGVLVIAKADQTISFAALSDKVYGDPSFSLVATSTSGLTVSFTVAGTCSLSGTTLTIDGAGICTVTASQAGDSNYNAATDVVRSFTIIKATPTITWSDPATIVYGTALDATQLNATASVPGTLVYTPTVGTVLNAGTNQPLVVDFTPTDTANYNTATKTVHITVTQASTTITWNNPADIVYGTVLGATQLNATASVAGTLVYTPAAGTALNAGQNQALSVSFTPTDTLNYTPSSKTVYINVTPAPLSVKAIDKSRAYGAANPYFTVMYTGFVLGQDETSLGGTISFDTPATLTSAVGAYPITPSGLTSSNYMITFVPGTLTVTQAGLMVVVDPQSKIYGSANPTLTGTLSGVLNNDNITVTYATTATDSSPVGGYPITATLVDPDNKQGNYAVTITNSTLTVNPAALTVKADNKSKIYGSANPAFTVSYSGFVLSENESVLSGTLSFNTSATDSSPVATYPITPGGLTSSNYAITFVDGTLTVNPAALTVTTDPATKVYGSSNPAFTVSYSGFVLGEGANVLSGTLSFNTTATTSSPVGIYSVTPGGLASANYTLTFVAGNLSVTPASLTVKADDKSKVYGSANPAFTVSYNGFVLSDSPAALNGTPGFTTVATESTGVGTYTITPGGLTSANYNITFVDGNLVITPAPLTVKADDQTRSYGASNPVLTGVVTGVLNNDGITATYATTATSSSSIGAYSIVPTLVDLNNRLNNYTVTSINGTLTITASALTVLADSKTKVYGEANPTLTGTLTGVQPGDNITVTYTTTATTSSGAGNYDIVPVLSDPGTRLGNYTVTLTNGTLTITKAGLTVTANPSSKIYGSVNPVFSASYNGFVLSDTESVLGGTLGFTTSATDSSPVGTYTVTPSGLSSPNYTITFANGTLTVTPAALTVKTDAATKVYGAANPAFTVSYTGFVLGETSSVLGGTLSFNTSATETSAVGAYPVTPSGLTSSNYAISFVDGTLTVTQAGLTVVVNPQNKIYGSANPTLTGTLSGVQNGDNITVTYATTATDSSSVGSYPITATLVDPDNKQGNYTVTITNSTLAVTPVTLTVTTNPATKVYGQPNPAFTVNYSGFVLNQNESVLNGTLAFNTLATASSGVNSYSVTPGGLSSPNYAITFVDGVLTVTPAPLTVTTNPATKVYGSTNPVFSVSYSGFVLSDTASVLSGILTFNTSATDSSPVGSYNVTPGGLTSGNYAITFVDGSLAITPAALTITAGNKAKLFGDAVPAFTVSYSGFVLQQDQTALGGTLNCTTTGTTTSPVGTYPITCSGLTSSNYALTFVDGTLTVGTVVLTVTTNPATKVYGAANPAFSVSYSGFVPGENESVLSGTLTFTTLATDSSPVGSYSVTPGGLTSPNYAINFVAGQLGVTPAALTVTADGKSKVYGDANPAFTVSYNGFVLNETSSALSGTLGFSTDATASSSVGPYSITPGGLTSSNYTITFLPGTLTVTPAPLAVKADDKARSYGAVNPALTGVITGIVNSDNITATYSTGATTTSPVGTYTIVPALVDPDNRLGNYTVTPTNGTLTVGVAILNVTADNKSKTYGDANPAFTVSYTGFVANDNQSALSGTLTFNTLATTSSAVGTYPVTPGGLTSTNYSIVYTDGTLTVNPALLTVTANPSTKVYGQPNPAFNASYNGFVLSETPGGLNGTLAFTTAATAGSAVGVYSVTPGGVTSPNYTITFVPGNLSVTPAALTVTADDKSKVYGSTNPLFTVSYTGLVSNDTPASLGGTLSLTTLATTSSPVGNYAITPSGLTSSNYTITFVPGTLTVTKAALTVTADDKSKVYGDPLPTFTASYNGFVLGETASVLGGTLTFTTPATPLSLVGTYPITPSGLTSSNYAITFVNGTLTVTAYLDHTAPTTVASLSPAANAAGWNNSNVTVTLAATDEMFGSGVKSITYSATGAQPIVGTTVNASSAILPVITTQGITTITFFAKDNVGNTETSKTVVVRLDKTGPTSVTGTPDRSPDTTNGWYNHPVTINFSGFDLLSGIASCTSTTYSGPSGSNLSISGSCTDKAGNTTTATYKGIKYDATAPVSTGVITQGAAPAGTDGWYPYSINVNLNTVDEANGSGVKQLIYSAVGAGGFATKTSSNGFASFAVTKNGITFINYQGLDQAGNLEPVKTLMVKIDTTAPTVTASVSPAPNAANWNNSDVLVTLTGSDNASGVKSISYQINGGGTITTVSGTTATIPVTTNGTTSITYWATDLAGNGNSGFGKTISVKIDKVAPTITSSNDGAAYKLNQNAKATYSCSDPGGSGVASCVGSVATNSKLNTTSLGTKSYTVTATDKAGNTYTRTITYTVVA